MLRLQSLQILHTIEPSERHGNSKTLVQTLWRFSLHSLCYDLLFLSFLKSTGVGSRRFNSPLAGRVRSWLRAIAELLMMFFLSNCRTVFLCMINLTFCFFFDDSPTTTSAAFRFIGVTISVGIREWYCKSKSLYISSALSPFFFFFLRFSGGCVAVTTAAFSSILAFFLGPSGLTSSLTFARDFRRLALFFVPLIFTLVCHSSLHHQDLLSGHLLLLDAK
mmetsp:Transcript_18476/g.33271  ORF Transcript_18476/g.33271 Transcript_18476/m.33271 type:complete len:220 (+) Transcript_18476:445-1104(+)